MDVTILQHILINANPCCVLQYMFRIRKLCSHKITDAYRTMKHVCFKGSPLQIGCTLEHIYINLDPCCVQWYKFHVYRGKSSGHTCSHTHLPIYVHQNRETWLMSWAHSSISHGDDTILLHTLINFCIQQCKSDVFRW